MDGKNYYSHRLILMPSGRRGDIEHDTTVLQATRKLGIELESICGGRQTCGKCLINVETGVFPKHNIKSSMEHLTAPDRRELEYATKHNIDLTKQRLACGTSIIGDLLLTIPESSQLQEQIIRKSAGELTVNVAPVVRLIYIEVPSSKFGDRADWERVQAILIEQWNLPNITLPFHLLSELQGKLRQQNGAITITLWQNNKIIRIEAGYVESLYGIAIDIGSTTLAAYLCNLQSGEVLATETMMNPQMRYGEDIISRITYVNSEEDGLQKLHGAILDAINELCERSAQSAAIDPTEVVDVVLVGNTVMHHLVLGIDPVELGHVPFTPAIDSSLDVNAHNFGLTTINSEAQVHILPCIAGHVGADNVAVLLAEHSQLNDEITLIVDIGTNAEILLGTKDRLLSASSPTGPAFEGAQILHGQRAAPGAIERVRIGENSVRYKIIGDERWSDQLEAGESLHPTGICGSGIIEAVSELFTSGLIDVSGRFVVDAIQCHERFRRDERGALFTLATADKTATGDEIVVTQKDIREIQLAKGALFSGVQLLMDRLGVDHVDHIRLAGAFGSYIDPEYAMRIGLIPRCDLSNATAIGNAAGDGARIALLNAEQRRNIQELVRQVEYVETAAESKFQELFMNALAFPDSEKQPEP